MKLPKTTKEKPYIEFKFDKKGNINLSATSDWWGGKNSGFRSTDGSEGNTCRPKDFNNYIKAFKLRKIKIIEKEIKYLEDKINTIKSLKLNDI